MSELFKVYTANVSGVCEKPKYDPEVNNFFYKSIKLKFDSNFYDNNQVVITRLAYNYQIQEALQRDNEIKNNSISPKELYDAIWDRKAIVIVDKCYWWKI